MDECMDVMASALTTLAKGGAILPLRPLMRIPQKAGILGMMPAYMETPDALGVKVITVFNGNHGTEYDSHQGVVLLFEADHGSIVAQPPSPAWRRESLHEPMHTISASSAQACRRVRISRRCLSLGP
jgi:ornithine cyclodeaminase/alanine dehydrogenase-like protein (mu-crystallin family)